MGARLVALAAALVVLAAGALLGSSLSQWWASPERPAGEALPAGAAGDLGRVRVEVLNAGGKGGMARAATDALRDGGFDVVFFGNAAAFDREQSVVLDRVGQVAMARAVADALGIASVLSQPDTNLYLDVTVFLGEDWSPARAPAAPQVETALPWWHPGRWLRAARQTISRTSE